MLKNYFNKTLFSFSNPNNLVFLSIFSKMYQSPGGSNNDELIDQLAKLKIISSKRIEETMKKIDRKNFCLTNPYTDSPQSIGYSVTISAPHMHAMALELLNDKLQPGANCLDVGSGSGYLTACMALLVQPTGKVYGIDHIKELIDKANENIRKDKPELLESKTIELVVGDGRNGYIEGGPYDVIHVGAAASELHQTLIDQLKVGGKLIIPIGKEGSVQKLEKIEKLENGQIKREHILDVRFVPLTDKNYQYGKIKED